MAALEFSRNYTVCPPRAELVYPIPQADWEHIKDLVRKIDAPSRLWPIQPGCASSLRCCTPSCA